MNRQNFHGVGEIFWQRRYGVRLGRRYALAAASAVLLSVFSTNVINKNPLAGTRTLVPEGIVRFDTKNASKNYENH
jgi:hypothetical protein